MHLDAIPSRAIRQRFIADRHRNAPWLFFKVATGLSRLSGDYCNPNTSQRIPAAQDLAKAEDCRPAFINSWLGEWNDFEPSAERVFNMQCCGSIPLVVISQDPESPKRDVPQTWDAVQERLKGLSSRSMRIIARNSRHFIMVDRPDVVVAGVGMVTAELHNASQRMKLGRTIWR